MRSLFFENSLRNDVEIEAAKNVRLFFHHSLSAKILFNKSIMVAILGSGMWGWTIPPKTAYQLLDAFYEAGFRHIDTATNYPVNKNPDHWRLSERIIQDWLQINGVTDLKIWVKVGSINNLFTPEHNLQKSFLLINLEDYQHKFGENLDIFGVHWDNRDNISEIQQSFEAFVEVQKAGLTIGLSGIKHPELYAQCNQTHNFDFQIQIKHNLVQSDYKKYHTFHGKPRFVAYGINAKGLKLNPKAYTPNSYFKTRGGDPSNQPAIIEQLKSILNQFNQHTALPPLSTFNDLAMIYAFHSPDMNGILLGPSNSQQLQNSLSLFRSMEKEDYENVYKQLKNL